MAGNNGGITSGANYKILAGQKTYQDYKKQNDVNMLNQQLAQAKLGALQAEGGLNALGLGKGTPSIIQIAKYRGKLQDAGDVRGLNNLDMAGKYLEKGLAMQNDGTIAPYQGYVNAVGDISRGKQIAETQGKEIGTASSGLAKTRQDVKTMIDVIENIENSPGLDSVVGKIADPAGGNLGFVNLPSSRAANFQAYADQLQGKVFLQAYEDLRGTGQITQVEGLKGEVSKAALQTAQSPEQYRKNLKDLKDIVKIGLLRAEQKAKGNLNYDPNQSSGSLLSPFKNFQGKPIPQKSIDLLLANPSLAPTFEGRYGISAQQILNGNNGQ